MEPIEEDYYYSGAEEEEPRREERPGGRRIIGPVQPIPTQAPIPTRATRAPPNKDKDGNG